MRALLIASIACGACASRVNPEYCANHPSDHAYCPYEDGGATADAPPLCIGSNKLALCVDAPQASVMLPAMLDSDGSPLCLQAQPAMWKANGQPDACIITGTTISATSTTVTGGRPLVLVASDSISVSQLLDASSHYGAGSTGPGADPASCVTGLSPGSGGGGGGGGAGGTFFGAVGGDGGRGNGSEAGGTAGMAVTMPMVLGGGCPGQVGGSSGGAGGVGGYGGGAMFLAAVDQIDLSGATVAASGAGGAGAALNVNGGGGGGGGSGGMIVLYAGSSIATTNTLLSANGGGGGGGGDQFAAGSPGSDPDPSMPLTAAGGGTGGAAGGSGFALNSNAQMGDVGNGGGYGGGGGGGGGGYILANHMIGATMVSPMPTTM
ncbi:MAG TPA: hypothetical protein VMJ10_11915 [Kofleriaceae bacterium]|nr:hypothetical protein [Kofleriaceae bacterium]